MLRGLARLNHHQAPDGDLSSIGQHDVSDLGIRQHVVNLLSGEQFGHKAHTLLSTALRKLLGAFRFVPAGQGDAVLLGVPID